MDSPSLMRGYVMKRGPKAGSRWQTRWAELRDRTLRYYKDQGGKELGVFKLSAVSAWWNAGSDSPSPELAAFAFALDVLQSDRTHRTFNFCVWNDDQYARAGGAAPVAQPSFLCRVASLAQLRGALAHSLVRTQYRSWTDALTQDLATQTIPVRPRDRPAMGPVSPRMGGRSPGPARSPSVGTPPLRPRERYLLDSCHSAPAAARVKPRACAARHWRAVRCGGGQGRGHCRAIGVTAAASPLAHCQLQRQRPATRGARV